MKPIEQENNAVKKYVSCTRAKAKGGMREWGCIG